MADAVRSGSNSLYIAIAIVIAAIAISLGWIKVTQVNACKVVVVTRAGVGERPEVPPNCPGNPL